MIAQSPIGTPPDISGPFFDNASPRPNSLTDWAAAAEAIGPVGEIDWLTDDQRQAAREIVAFLADPQRRVAAIVGYAGVGKSTLIAEVVARLPRQMQVAAIATTHKAVGVLKRFFQARGISDIQTATVASMLQLRPSIDLQTGKREFAAARSTNGDRPPIESVDLTIVDEASTVEPSLQQQLEASLAPGQKLLYVGDPAQLPPVGFNESPALAAPMVAIKQVVRHGGPILDLATDLRHNLGRKQLPPWPSPSDTLALCDRRAFRQSLADAFREARHGGPLPDGIILAFTNAAVKTWNSTMIRYLYGKDAHEFAPGYPLIANEAVVRPGGDAQILLQNSAEVIVEAAEPASKLGLAAWKLRVRETNNTAAPPVEVHAIAQEARRDLDRRLEALAQRAQQAQGKQRGRRWREYFAVKEAFADLRPGFAMTLHKSQGSTFERVWIDLPDVQQIVSRWQTASNIEMRNRLLYVGITRAQQAVRILHR